VQLHYITAKRNAKILFIGQSKIANDDLILQNREARQSAPSGTNSPAKTHWAALCAARENLGKFPVSQIIVRLYDITRTYFIKNS
jgi:hypothetical protein